MEYYCCTDMYIHLNINTYTPHICIIIIIIHLLLYHIIVFSLYYDHLIFIFIISNKVGNGKVKRNQICCHLQIYFCRHWPPQWTLVWFFTKFDFFPFPPLFFGFSLLVLSFFKKVIFTIVL